MKTKSKGSIVLLFFSAVLIVLAILSFLEGNYIEALLLIVIANQNVIMSKLLRG